MLQTEAGASLLARTATQNDSQTMRTRNLCLITTSLLGLVMASTDATAQTRGNANRPANVSKRVLDRAVKRLHRDLTEELDIWVDRSDFANAWVATTDHFSVRTTKSYGLAKDLASGLETMLGHFRKVLGSDYVPPKPFPVFVLPGRADYNAFGESHGEHHSSFFGSFHALSHAERPVAAEWIDNPTLLRMQITHSVVHQYLHSAFPASVGKRTAWVEEGLAAYFTFYWDPKWTLDQYLLAKKDGRLLDLGKVLLQPISQYGNDTEVRMLQLAIFFDYLLRLREDTKTTIGEDGKPQGAFRDYLIATLEGRSPLALPFSRILINRAKLAQDFLDYDFSQ